MVGWTNLTHRIHHANIMATDAFVRTLALSSQFLYSSEIFFGGGLVKSCSVTEFTQMQINDAFLENNFKHPIEGFFFQLRKMLPNQQTQWNDDKWCLFVEVFIEGSTWMIGSDFVQMPSDAYLSNIKFTWTSRRIILMAILLHGNNAWKN